jgi:hypothetical protein
LVNAGAFFLIEKFFGNRDEQARERMCWVAMIGPGEIQCMFFLIFFSHKQAKYYGSVNRAFLCLH